MAIAMMDHWGLSITCAKRQKKSFKSIKLRPAAYIIHISIDFALEIAFLVEPSLYLCQHMNLERIYFCIHISTPLIVGVALLVIVGVPVCVCFRYNLLPHVPLIPFTASPQGLCASRNMRCEIVMT